MLQLLGLCRCASSWSGSRQVGISFEPARTLATEATDRVDRPRCVGLNRVVGGEDDEHGRLILLRLMKGKGLKEISTGLARSNRAKASSRTGVSPPGASVLACRFASAISHRQYFGRRSDMSGTYTAT
jgi:hypothetical protein